MVNFINKESTITAEFPLERLTLTTTQPFGEHFAHKYSELVRPYFEKMTLIQQGKVLEAVSIKPSGIWYANAYAAALLSLKDTLIPVNGHQIPASQLYRKLREQNAFYQPVVSKTYWEHVPDPGSLIGTHQSALKMKEGVKPSEAFLSFQRQLSLINCTFITTIAFYLTLLERYGEDHFNTVLGEMRRQYSFYIGEPSLNTYMYKMMSKITIIMRSVQDSAPQIQVGQTYYMNNYPSYNKKHPHGESQGINLVCTGKNELNEPLFTGLGLKPEGITLLEIAEFLCSEYNQEPVSDETLLSPAMQKKFQQLCCLHFILEGKSFLIPFIEIEQAHLEDKKLTQLSASQMRLLPSLYREVQNCRQTDKKLSIHQVTMAEFLDRENLFPATEYDKLDDEKIALLFGPSLYLS